MISRVVLFGIGSPIIVDFLESLARAGLALAAGVRNRPGTAYLPEEERVVAAGEFGPELADLPFLVPLFTPANRQIAAREARALGLTRPFTLIDPTAAMPRRIEVGAGTYVNCGCNIGGAASLGAFVLINRGANIGHHARLGDFASVGPGATLGGQVTLGKGALIGAGAVVLPQVTIGDNSVVAAGAVVSRDVADRCLVAGHPARIVRTGIPGAGELAVE